MLQTCTRCRNRRIKCDSRLPACANCARNDLECTFHDDALQEDIPRSYIQSLNNRIENLTSQLALHQPEDPPISASTISSPSYRPLHLLVPAKTGLDLHLDLSVPSIMTSVAFEAILSPGRSNSLEQDLAEDVIPQSPYISYTERSQLAPSSIRFLLRRYERCIRPQYDLPPVPDLISSNSDPAFKKLPDADKFKLLIACGVAAARESYKSPDWRPLAHICRNWAEELVNPIISAGNTDALVAILSLIVYELADSSRGVIWELLDMGARTCLQLGWHQTSPGLGSLGGTGNRNSPEETRLVSILKDIDGSMQTIFNRPGMLRNFTLPLVSATEGLIQLHSQVWDHLYDTGQIYERRSCPFVGEIRTCMELLETFDSSNPVTHEIWLLYLPVCVKHKQCIQCFQEPDDFNSRGMTALRYRVVSAASALIGRVHRDATSVDGFVPPVIAGSRAFSAGCSLATAVLKRWVGIKAHGRDFVKCTEILTMFAPYWSGGHEYLRIWNMIVDRVFTAV
ncbi:hypothetical protein BJX99DRAFT_263051 [Aspergillus californicus]